MLNKIIEKKHLIMICLLSAILICSNIGWYFLYKRENERVKNVLIPPLSNDYYSNQVILTNNTKKYLSDSIEEYPEYAKEIWNSNISIDNLKQIYDVPLINQNPKYPNGCEAASAVMLLNYYGIDITLDEFIEKLPNDKIYEEDGVRYGPNPALFYAGDPSNPTGGWGCFDIVIAKTINNILREKNSTLKVKRFDNKMPLSDIAFNMPCLIWVTIDYKEATDIFTWQSYDKKETYTYPRNEHVVVLTGCDDEYYYINDPLKDEKNIPVKKEILEKSHDSLGRQFIGIWDYQS